MKLSKTRISFFWGEEKMKANSTQCSQASLPLIQRAFLYKVKEKKKTNIKRQPVVCLEKKRLGTLFSLWLIPAKRTMLSFLTISLFNDKYKNTFSRAFGGPTKQCLTETHTLMGQSVWVIVCVVEDLLAPIPFKLQH